MELHYNIPDLSTLKPNAALMAAKLELLRTGIKSYCGQALIVNFVRLVDLAVAEYQVARKMLVGPFSDGLINPGIAAGFSSSGNFEICITTIKRAIDFLKAIRGHPHIPLDIKHLCPRQANVLKGGVEGKVTAMRDAITHLEGEIKKENLQEGQAYILLAEENHLELGQQKITYTDLASWIQELHTISTLLATELAKYREA